MVLSEVIPIISGIFVSVGGAGAIIWKFSTYFGNMWAENHLESIKKDYQKEIEDYKTHLEMLKDTSLRYSGQQFELYNKLWHSLYDLKLTADAIWDEANWQNLKDFSKQLKITTDEVEKSYLFIEEIHYQDLKGLLEQFSDYQFGKTKIIQLYLRRSQESIDSGDIRYWINHNGDIKQKYNEYINEIRSDLKTQIRGDG